MSVLHDFSRGTVVIIKSFIGGFVKGSIQVVEEDYDRLRDIVGIKHRNDSRGYWNVLVGNIRHASDCYKCRFECKLEKKCVLFEAK